MSTSVPPSTEDSAQQHPPEQVVLSNGGMAQLVPRDGGWSLEINSARQSHLGPAGAPPALAAVRWMHAALGAHPPARSAHLGGGLLTLPRAIAHDRPGAEQVVVELEPALVALAEDRFGLPDGVTVRCEDARTWLESPSRSDLDAIVIDIFTADRVPPAFTSVECFRAAYGALSDRGRLVINSVAGPDLEFTRRELATLHEVFAHVAMIVQGSSLHGLRFGNAILVGSKVPLDTETIRARLKGDESRPALVTEVDPIIDGAAPVTDADQLWSPEPRMPKFDDALKALDAVQQMKKQVEALRDEARAAVESDPAERDRQP
ncbi:MAG TPA: fused MFS/spermidine synthase [Ruania sp.]|nr:fused MFS/spermidine synthase [Ruania sp.]